MSCSPRMLERLEVGGAHCVEVRGVLVDGLAGHQVSHRDRQVPTRAWLR